MVEKWDAYDKNFRLIEGLTLIRGQELPKDVYHLVCDIAVRHIDGTYLLMQRDYCKHLGGLWELTAGGSALQGENPMECARRELKEETGIEATDLVELDRIVHENHQSLCVEFLCITDCNKAAVTLQEGETIAYKWVTREEILNIQEDMASTRTLKMLAERKF